MKTPNKISSLYSGTTQGASNKQCQLKRAIFIDKLKEQIGQDKMDSKQKKDQAKNRRCEDEMKVFLGEISDKHLKTLCPPPAQQGWKSTYL